MVADLMGVGIGHFTYGNQAVQAFCLPTTLGPSFYEVTGNRSTALALSSASSLLIRPPSGEHRDSRTAGLAGGNHGKSVSGGGTARQTA